MVVKRFDSSYYEAHESTDGEYVLHSDYAALQASHDRLLEALNGLTECCKSHDSAIANVMGKPPGWKDSYLDAAREAIAATQPFTET